MTTLSDLKQEIADDIARSDLTSQIASAISSAINYYQHRRFFFNETRTSTFDTVADVDLYTSEDSVIQQEDPDVDQEDIPKFIDVDSVLLNDGSNEFILSPASSTEMQYLLGSGTSTGRPYRYSYFQESFRFYPMPDDIYTITPIGHIMMAEPDDDDDEDNVWMLNAYELIRCRAKAYLSIHVTMDLEMARIMAAAEQDAYSALRRTTAKKQGIASKTIEATDF